MQTSEEDRQKLNQAAQDVIAKLRGASIRVDIDSRENYQPGWKFNHWELKGVPIRLEIGPKDLAKGEATAVIRHSGEKVAWKLENLADTVTKALDDIHDAMFQK